jgi:hypothetical protein
MVSLFHHTPPTGSVSSHGISLPSHFTNRFSVVAWYLSSITLHPEHTDTYSPHPVHIEMEEFSDARFKQRAVIEFLTVEKSLQLKFTDECKLFMVISVLT